MIGIDSTQFEFCFSLFQNKMPAANVADLYELIDGKSSPLIQAGGQISFLLARLG